MLILHLTTVTTPVMILAVLGAATLAGQTTQGVITGRLVNSITGRPVASATIAYASEVNASGGAGSSEAGGYYTLPLLSPGVYRVRVSAAGFQSQEVQELELRVASRIDLDFRLRPLSDVWEAGQYNSVFLPGSKTVVTFFGPDVDSSRSGSFEAQKGHVDTLETSVSEVIDSREINNLPLAGRDVYTMLVTQPGVTSDAATARGLGLSANGQRPSASNYLLDGLENNNYLVTGPLVTVAPEAIQEYRISINNFSAEYGRTTGFVANSITRSGSNGFHGVVYFYLINDFFNANGFQENLAGFPRAADKQAQPGFVITGPISKDRLFFSTSYEYFRNGSQQDPQAFTVPAAGFFGFTLPSSEAAQLLKTYPPPAVTGNGLTGQVTLAPPVEVDRTLAIQRVDYVTAKDRVMARAMGSFLAQPDFIWSPYPAFTSALHENTWSLAIADTHTFRPTLINEARAGFSDDDLHWNRAHSEIPTLVSNDGFLCLQERRSKRRTSRQSDLDARAASDYGGRGRADSQLGRLSDGGTRRAVRLHQHRVLRAGSAVILPRGDRPDGAAVARTAKLKSYISLPAVFWIHPGRVQDQLAPGSELWAALRAVRRAFEYRSDEGFGSGARQRFDAGAAAHHGDA
jgi:hypothetical protein